MLWVVASLPGEDLEKIQKYPENPLLRFFLSDPFMHFLVFGLLILLICRGFYQESKALIPIVRVGLIASGYGLIIEVYQGILPWRSFGLDDIVWNTVGVMFFLLLVKLSLSLRGTLEIQNQRGWKC